MRQLGGVWVLDYHSPPLNLLNTQTQVERFYWKLNGVRKFIFGDGLAWDVDFESTSPVRGTPPSGSDSSIVDAVDIVYFSGHGGPERAQFGDTSHDNGFAMNTELLLGDGILNWIVFDQCNILYEGNLRGNTYDVFDRWRQVFAGLHYMLGFHSEASDESKRGQYFAQRLNDGETLRTAWIKACIETEPASHEWAYLRAEQVDDTRTTNTYMDTWTTADAPLDDPIDPTCFIYARGTC